MKKLSPKRRAFVAAYLGAAAMNATEAARMAGYKSPGSQGHDLLKNPEVQKAVESGLERVEKKAEITLAEAVGILAGIARGEIGESKPITDLSGKLVATVEVPPKPGDRTKAVAQLSKMLGWDAPKRVLTATVEDLRKRVEGSPLEVAERFEAAARKLRAQAGVVDVLEAENANRD